MARFVFWSFPPASLVGVLPRYLVIPQLFLSFTLLLWRVCALSLRQARPAEESE